MSEIIEEVLPDGKSPLAKRVAGYVTVLALLAPVAQGVNSFGIDQGWWSGKQVGTSEQVNLIMEQKWTALDPVTTSVPINTKENRLVVETYYDPNDELSDIKVTQRQPRTSGLPYSRTIWFPSMPVDIILQEFQVSDVLRINHAYAGSENHIPEMPIREKFLKWRTKREKIVRWFYLPTTVHKECSEDVVINAVTGAVIEFVTDRCPQSK